MGESQTDRQSRKRYFATKNHEENEKGAARYFDEVRGGRSEEEARDIVKAAFGWGDRRLDNVLTTRASAFGPGTISEFEAVATNCIRRSELAAQAELRFYYQQLEDLESDLSAGEKHYEIKYSEGVSGKGDFWKSEKLPIREAQAQLLAKISEASVKPVAALRMFKADTVININRANELSGRSQEELDELIRQAKMERGIKEVDAEYSVEGEN